MYIQLMGAPGSGKSTLITELKKECAKKKIHLRVLNEDMSKKPQLTKIHEKILLLRPDKAIYRHQRRLITQCSEIKIEQKEDYRKFYIVDHTPIELVQFFNGNFAVDGLITPDQYAELELLARDAFLARESKLGMRRIFVYMLGNTKETVDRVKNRNRTGKEHLVINEGRVSRLNQYLIAHKIKHAAHHCVDVHTCNEAFDVAQAALLIMEMCEIQASTYMLRDSDEGSSNNERN